MSTNPDIPDMEAMGDTVTSLLPSSSPIGLETVGGGAYLGYMKLTRTQNAALTAGMALMGVGMLVGTLQDLSVPATGHPTRECESVQQCVRTVEFDRPGPCATCGLPAPVWVETKGAIWYVPSTEPGTTQEVGHKYCPADEVCKIYNVDPNFLQK